MRAPSVVRQRKSLGSVWTIYDAFDAPFGISMTEQRTSTKADKVRLDSDWDCSVGRDFCNVDFPNFGKPAMNRKAHNPYRQQRALLAIA